MSKMLEIQRKVGAWELFTKIRGLYCPPLIPAGIRRNPGNSRNSRGIKFGRGACQIDEMIPAEFCRKSLVQKVRLVYGDLYVG